MGGVRGLQRLAEVDDCLLRITKNGYEDYFKEERGVFMMTIVHEWGRDVSEEGKRLEREEEDTDWNEEMLGP